MKRCGHCGEVKPLTEFYTSRNGKPYPRCKVCARAVKTESYRRHAEQRRTYCQVWYREHVAERRQYSQARYPSKREYYIAAAKRWSQEHPERVKVNRQRHVATGYYKRYHEQNRERKNAKDRRWRHARPAVNLDRVRRREARKCAAPVVEKIDRAALYARDNWICYRCERVCTPANITLDHVVPLTRGGSHTADNLRVCCRSCNSRKGRHLLTELAYILQCAILPVT
jgi:5-methylcytosine-specific restriction endonuclease McrA